MLLLNLAAKKGAFRKQFKEKKLCKSFSMSKSVLVQLNGSRTSL